MLERERTIFTTNFTEARHILSSDLSSERLVLLSAVLNTLAAASPLACVLATSLGRAGPDSSLCQEEDVRRVGIDQRDQLFPRLLLRLDLLQHQTCSCPSRTTTLLLALVFLLASASAVSIAPPCFCLSFTSATHARLPRSTILSPLFLCSFWQRPRH